MKMPFSCLHWLYNFLTSSSKNVNLHFYLYRNICQQIIFRTHLKPIEHVRCVKSLKYLICFYIDLHIVLLTIDPSTVYGPDSNCRKTSKSTSVSGHRPCYHWRAWFSGPSCCSIWVLRQAKTAQIWPWNSLWRHSKTVC